MKHPVPLSSWPRASVFRHFINYQNPYFGITATIDCTTAYEHAKRSDLSFFLYYFYLSLKTANGIPEFRMRIDNGKPVIFDKVNGSPTILRDDGEMGYAMLEYHDTFEDFLPPAEEEIRRVKSLSALDTSKDCPETIYYSILPWIHFTSVEHPMDRHNSQGVPILTFGKIKEENGKKIMPVAVHAHHALMDGYHIHLFLEAFQKRLDGEI